MIFYLIFSTYLPFPVREELIYGAYFGPLRAGYSVMKIEEEFLEGEPVYFQMEDLWWQKEDKL